MSVDTKPNTVAMVKRQLQTDTKCDSSWGGLDSNCRGGCLEPTIRLNSENQVGEQAEGLEEQRGISTPLDEQHRLA